MASYFRWLDYSSAECQRMMDVIVMYKESDAQDRLGLGVIRDGLADQFFPGTGTELTRARYFFFV